MYDEADYIMLSALQHYLFCPRQCALIHVEQQWAENRYTAEGKVLHERADSNKSEWQASVRVVRTLPLCSRHFGLSGQADVVEFRPDGQVYPVEYKRGKPKADRCDEVQLCAQAFCLEEMLAQKIEKGALFYGQQRRRKEVLFDTALRTLTEEVIDSTHRLVQSQKTPSAEYAKKCESCSLFSLCLPKICTDAPSVGAYLKRMLGGDA